MVHQIAPSAFKMKKGGGHIFQLSLICTLKAIEVIKKVKKRKKDWVIELRQINTLCLLGDVRISCVSFPENPSLLSTTQVCGTSRVGWLEGKHPTFEQGVDFHWKLTFPKDPEELSLTLSWLSQCQLPAPVPGPRIRLQLSVRWT